MPGPGVEGAAGVYGQVQGRACPAPTARHIYYKVSVWYTSPPSSFQVNTPFSSVI